MRQWISFLSLVAVVLAGACAPAAPVAQPTTAPAATNAAAPGGAPAQKAGADAWDRLVEAAKREGKVTVIGPTGGERRGSLTTPFEQKYGITVEYWAEPGPGIPPRLSTERQAGQYLWDVVIGGGLEALLLPLNVLDPLEPALVLPEVSDPKQWRGSQLEFLDQGRTLLVMSPFHRGTLFTNPSLVRPEELKSYRDLLDPKWRGKIMADDPRKAGPGQATFSFFYLHPELGPDFLRSLASQDVVFLRDYAQEVDAVGQGRYPIAIGTSDSLAEERIRQGIPISIVDPRQLKEGSDVNPASGMVGLFNRAPNPNAAKLYLNWLLSKEGQTSWVRAAGYISNRLDVPTDHAPGWRVPQPGAVKTYGLPWRKQLGDEMLPLFIQLWGQ